MSKPELKQKFKMICDYINDYFSDVPQAVGIDYITDKEFIDCLEAVIKYYKSEKL